MDISADSGGAIYSEGLDLNLMLIDSINKGAVTCINTVRWPTQQWIDHIQVYPIFHTLIQELYLRI